MRRYSFVLIVIAFTMLVSYGCDHEGNFGSNYKIDHYVDTIYGHIILTTVCSNVEGHELSVSTLEIGTTKDNNRLSIRSGVTEIE